MRVHDEYIPEEVYAVIQRRVPEVCVEVLVEHDGGVLLARRTNEPLEGRWFWPGSRLYKGEGLEPAARRVARQELGLEINLTGRLGVYCHYWETSAVEGVDSRHTVNIVFRGEPVQETFEITLDDQHDAYRFVSSPEPTFHEYVRRYLRDAGYRAEKR